MKKLLLLAAVSALLAACGAKNSGSSTSPAAGTAPQTSAPTAAPTEAELKQAATATQESAGAEESTGDASLERLTAIPENVQLPNGRWKAGVNYLPIVPAQGTSAQPGEVEVLEIMWLGCPHCADLEPDLERWASKKPAYIKFVQEPVMWGTVHRAHGKLLATLQALHAQGKPDLVGKAFAEIHGARQNPLYSRTENDAETLSIQLAFAKANGISEADFKKEFNGTAVNARLQRAEELTRRYRVESVPVIIINGKYQTDVGMAGGKDQLLQLISDLAAVEKGR